MANGSWAALATLTLLAAPAPAQIVIDSTGKGPVIVGRDKGGIVVHVGRLEIHTGDEALDVSDFQTPSADLYNFNPTRGADGLSIDFAFQGRSGSVGTDGERIASLTHLLQRLNDAVNRQCEPIVAVFGKPCRLSESNLRAYFQPSLNESSGASANARFEIAAPVAAPKRPN